MKEVIIDAKNSIAGRVASIAAKEALKGNNVYIVNSEKAIISGDPTYVKKDYKEKVVRGDPYHGPFYPKRPDMILKRIIRGMVPRGKPHGKDAFRRIKTYISVPEELKGKEAIRLKAAENKIESKYIKLGDVSKSLGVRKTW